MTRRLVDYGSDAFVGEIGDYPPIAQGAIVRFKDVNYRVLDISNSRRITELYISKNEVHPQATPDYILDEE